jgi:hypothetical protein
MDGDGPVKAKVVDWFMVGVWVFIGVACLVEATLAGMGVWWLAHGAPSGATRTRTVMVECVESSPPLPQIGTAITCERTP